MQKNKQFPFGAKVRFKDSAKIAVRSLLDLIDTEVDYAFVSNGFNSYCVVEYEKKGEADPIIIKGDVKDDMCLVEDTFIDNLAYLEEHILNYYLSRGYERGGDWGFRLEINTLYKDKQLLVWFYNGKSWHVVASIESESIDEMYKKVYEEFRVGDDR
jgi:hypothetical protein